MTPVLHVLPVLSVGLDENVIIPVLHASLHGMLQYWYDTCINNIGLTGNVTIPVLYVY